MGGIAKIFSIKRSNLLEMQDFPKAWFLFLQFMQNAAASTNEEISLAALKSFQEALIVPAEGNAEGERNFISTSRNCV